jgi:MoaA/NifB/PqqE/SkfB family radical SAM enzyme
MKLIEIKSARPGVLEVNWSINNICTNSCSYCSEILWNGTNHHYDWSHAEKFLKVLFQKYEKTHFYLTGGEPTVSPFLLDLCQLIHENNGDIYITTNGVASIRKYEELSKYVLGFSFSWHPEFQKSNSEWLEKVAYISTLSHVLVRVMAPADNLEKVQAFVDQIKSMDRNFQYEIVKIQPRGDISIVPFTYKKEDESVLFQTTKRINVNTTNFLTYRKHKMVFDESRIAHDAFDYVFNVENKQDIKNYFQKDSIGANDLAQRGLDNFQGWECNAGIESLFIDWNGEVKKAVCKVDGIIGNVQDTDNIKWPAGSVICPFKRCDCIADVRITKKIKNETT